MGQAPDPICVGHVHARAKASRGQRDGRWYWEARWQAGEGERPSRALGWLTRSATAAARILAASAALRSAGGARVDRKHPTAGDVAAWLGTPGDLRDVVVLLDPPYDRTQGYEAGDLPRSEVLALADRWTAADATVAICEHDPIPGWRSVDLTAARVGPARTATKRTDEWLSVRGVEPRRPVAQLGLL